MLFYQSICTTGIHETCRSNWEEDSSQPSVSSAFMIYECEVLHSVHLFWAYFTPTRYWNYLSGLQSHVPVLSSCVSIFWGTQLLFRIRRPKFTIISHIRYNSIHEYLDVKNHMYQTLWDYTFRQRTQMFVSTRQVGIREGGTLDWLIGSKEETLLVIQPRLCLVWMTFVMRIGDLQHLPGTRSSLEEDLYQRFVIRDIKSLLLSSQILLLFLFIQCCLVTIREVLGELPLREFPSASVAVLAPTTAWWHTSNKPGSVRKEFSWWTELVFIAYWKILLALNVRGKKGSNTVKICISAINIMVDSLLMTEKFIAFGELGQNVVHCRCQ